MFRKIQEWKPRSIILASGTLKPMKDLEEELESKFEVKYESDHVIDSKQMICGVISKTLQGSPISFRFSNRGNLKMIKEWGESIWEIMKSVPDGMLIFFPSYSLMVKTIFQWTKFKIIEKMSFYKKIFQETNNSSEFPKLKEEYENHIYYNSGAVFFSVWRGKVSEGLDFPSRAAQSVIIIGVPNANWSSARVQLKIKYMDSKKEEDNSKISGKEKC